MTVDEFRNSTAGRPPAGLSHPLLALWHDAHGDWEAAHDAAQREQDADGAWVHGYLHRKEGDVGNAGYWYRRAGKPLPKGDLDSEWNQITGSLLGRPGRSE